MKETNLAIRGVEYPTQDPKVKDKMKETCKDRYGCEHPMQDPNCFRKMF